VPSNTTFAIFVGGIIKWIVDTITAKQSLSKEKLENTGILLASGLIAGEALMGIIIAATVVAGGGVAILPTIIKGGSPILSVVVFAVLAYVLIRIPIQNAKTKA